MTTKSFFGIAACACGLFGLANLNAQAVIAIENVTLIDGTGRPAIPNSCVVVSGSHVLRIASCAVSAPAGAQRISGKGKFLIPGLMDVHVHLRGGGGFGGPGRGPNEQVGIRHLHSYIYSGVTTILDVGNNPDFIFKL